MNEKITEKDISIVVQGPVNESTALCVASIRKFLPQSFIIVSTDSSSKSSDVDCDLLIVNPDIGANFCVDLGNNKPNNINRQITSTFNGIKQVTTKYTLKLRSDFIITGNNFLNYFDKFTRFNSQNRFFEKKILSCVIYTKKPRKPKFFSSKGTGYPYHLSDFIQFGLTQDLQKFWDIDLASDTDLNWFNEKTVPKKEEFSRYRYTVEQQILIQFMRKNNITYFADFFCDRNEENASHTDLILANNFVLLSFEQFCVWPMKDIFKPNANINSYYTLSYITSYNHHDWTKLYKKYCDNSFKTDFIDREFFQRLSPLWFLILADLGVLKNYQLLIEHLKKLIEPSNLHKKASGSFFVLLCLVKFLGKFSTKLLARIWKLASSSIVRSKSRASK